MNADRVYALPLSISPRTDIEFIATVSANSVGVSVEFDGRLI
jgi:hypothetical protein